MFKRLTPEQWQEIIPYLGFGITFTVFIIVLWKAIRMRKSTADRIALLPFDQPKETSNYEDGRKD
ncbi:MAG: hypothetical protein AAGA58_02140 [Verrucomicrobiota bacterium]